MGIEFGHSMLGIQAGVRRRTTKPFQPDAIYPGKTLAAKLHVREGERLLLAAKTASGGLNGIKLPMAAAIATGSGRMDKNAFFISLSNARRLLRTGAAATELYVYLHDPARAAAVAARIRPMLPAGVVARTLAEQNPAFHDYLTAVQSFMILIDAVILFLASFVIINTMMMAVYERAREIGTLKALGMEEGTIIRAFGLEGGLLGLTGGLAGALLGTVLIAVLGHTGIDLTAMMEGIDMPMEYIIRPSLSVGTVLVSLLLAILIPAGAAMLPASRIRRLSAAEALRRA
jgi:putative ABC transport system permease protein